MRKIIIPLVLIFLIVVMAIGMLKTRQSGPTHLMELKAEFSKEKQSSVDHSKFEILQKKFKSPQEVTEACISCHTERHTEIMKSNHWNWERAEYVEGRGIVYLGKKNALNNFCIGADDNEEACAKCHIGYGMDEKDFSYSNERYVDCLVCHDNTESYAKAPNKGGAPVATLDLNEIAMSVGNTKRSNCGVCHFYGGGGDNVKHGDLGSSMFEPTRDIDVHMDIKGMNMECTECHTTENHNISGKMYSLSSMNLDRTTCEQCHTERPHESDILNNHTLKVACQTCHIPEYAKAGNATKMTWDWSTAGKLKNGEPYHEEDENGNHTYLSIKGSFTYATNVKPDYIWFNGTADHYLLGDVVEDTTKPLVINNLHGSYADVNSKIVPVKIHRSKQPFDPINKMLIKPKLFSPHKGDGAYWIDFDWVKAAEVGMKNVNMPFSGKVSFIETEMYWPVNHMVATKEKTVQCIECHTSDNGRLANLDGFYMPARDKNAMIEYGGKVVVIMSILGVLIHGGVRIFSSKKQKGRA
ncbi:MAG: tetrathionate reductase family octaheme c-type cytochrome [Rhodothermaceae bacterium]